MYNDHARDPLTQIYKFYKKTMFYVANQILKDTYLSEDAVHNAFIKIYKNLYKIEQIESYKTKAFVVIIARNAAIDIYNQNHKITELPIESNNNVIEKKSSVEEIIFSKQNYKKLINMINQFPKIYSDVFF